MTSERDHAQARIQGVSGAIWADGTAPVFSPRGRGGFQLGLHQRSLSAMEASRRPRAFFARMARRARRGYVARHDRHKRAHAHLSLSPGRPGAGLRYPRGHVSQPDRARRRHRGILERGAVNGHGMARIQRAVCAFARGRHAHASALDRGAGHVRRSVLSHKGRDHL